MLNTVRRLLGSDGRRKIYERTGRVESRVVELQIQLARRFEALDARLRALDGAIQRQGDTLVTLNDVSSARHTELVENASKLLSTDVFTAGMLYSGEDRRIKAGVLYDSFEALQSKIAEHLNETKIIVDLPNHLRMGLDSVEDAARNRHADVMNNLLSTTQFGLSLVDQRRAIGVELEEKLKSSIRLLAERQNESFRALMVLSEGLRSDAANQFHELFHRVVRLSELPDQVRQNFSEVEKAATTRHSDLMNNLLSTTQFGMSLADQRREIGVELEEKLQSSTRLLAERQDEVLGAMVLAEGAPHSSFQAAEEAAKARHSDLMNNLLHTTQFGTSLSEAVEKLMGQQGQDPWSNHQLRVLAEIGREIRAEAERLRDLEVIQAQHTGPAAWPMAYELSTQYPVALHSDDHRFPRGAANDNTRSPRFVAACQKLFGRSVAHLDLGCAGGGLVRDFLIGGHRSMGLEGSDWSLLEQRAEWRALGSRLRTCDITKPFKITDQGHDAAFDVITAWEVLEHLPAESLPQFFSNVRSHLAVGGLFVASIATFEDKDLETGAVWHVTIEGRDWWEEHFRRAGLEVTDTPFRPRDYVRGSGSSIDDWDAVTQPHMGFHLVAKVASTTAQ